MLKVVEKTPVKSQKTQREEKKSKKNNLPPDAYKDEINPLEIEVDETRKFVLSVKRGGEFGLPMCDVRQYQTTELYTGFTKKGINFPIVLIPDLIEQLQAVYEECEEKSLFDDFEDE